jgi:SAM-dependent methyltransferase
MRYLFIFIAFLVIGNCHTMHHHHENHPNHHMHQRTVDELAERFDHPSRDAWAKPDWVLSQIAKTPTRVWEIGSGTGYFTFKMAEKGWDVTATDPNQEFLDWIDQRKAKSPPKVGSKITTQKVEYHDPKIPPNQYSVVFLSNTYHHIEDRISFFQKVKKALPKGGKLFIVDFELGKGGEGPPEGMRISSSQASEELKKAGFEKVQIDNKGLPHQYFLVAE